MKDYIKILILLIVSYLSVAYITLQLNPLKWEQGLRITISIIIFIITMTIIVDDIKLENDN